MLRGVYYKNMKWQAAIKVEKKQIHLGTVASMEEAAHLYDRLADRWEESESLCTDQQRFFFLHFFFCEGLPTFVGGCRILSSQKRRSKSYMGFSGKNFF